MKRSKVLPGSPWVAAWYRLVSCAETSSHLAPAFGPRAGVSDAQMDAQMTLWAHEERWLLCAAPAGREDPQQGASASAWRERSCGAGGVGWAWPRSKYRSRW